MSLSNSTNKPSSDPNTEPAFYLSSQEQQAADTSNKRRKHTTSPPQEQQAADTSNKSRKRTTSLPIPTTVHPPLHFYTDLITNSWCLITNIKPFTSTSDLKEIMSMAGLYYNFSTCDEPMTLALDDVHLCQFQTLQDNDIPTHAVWICNSESGFNDVKQVLTTRGILSSYTVTFTARLTTTDPLKILPIDTTLEEPSNLAKMWKRNCPDGKETDLYNYILTKDDASLHSWITIYHGKSAHSL